MASSVRSNQSIRNSPLQNLQYRNVSHGGELQRLVDGNLTNKSNTTIPANYSGHPSGTDFKVDNAHEILRDYVAPMIQSRSANAMTVDRTDFYYYPKRFVGRRCSCYEVESTPLSECPVCRGQGVVGGFEKFGCRTEILDFTTPNLRCANIVPNFGMDTRPVFFTLVAGAQFGFIEADFEIKANVGVAENFFLFQPTFNRNTKVYVVVGALKFELKTVEDLSPHLASSKITIRVEMEAGDKRPLFSHFQFRYKIRQDLIVWGDATVEESTIQSSDPIGTLLSYQEIQIVFDGKILPKVNSDDILYRIFDARMFKIVGVKELWVGRTLTSIETRARFLLPELDAGQINMML